MLISKDYYYYYKNVLRLLLLYKFNNLYNSFIIPSLDKIIIYCSILKLNDLDDISIFNYIYFFKFFLGLNLFFTYVKINLRLGIITYNVNIKIILLKHDIYLFLSFFLNDIIFSNDLEYLFYFSKRFNIYSCSISKLLFFSEKKSNLGLLNLNIPLNLKFFLSGFDSNNSILFLDGLKINLF